MITIVLVNTSHPGNIGAVARAMKTMGLSSLYLVRPKLFPHAEATAMAAGADDVLYHATIVDSLEEALADCTLVFAASARLRSQSWPVLSPREMGEKIQRETKQKIALVFGNEQSGLTNEQLQLAHYHVHIPSCERFSSLNLAQAVQILCYEIRLMSLCSGSYQGQNDEHDIVTYPDITALEDFYKHLEKMLVAVGFINPEKPKLQMQKLRRLFTRARLEASEVQLLRGICREVFRSLGR